MRGRNDGENPESFDVAGSDLDYGPFVVNNIINNLRIPTEWCYNYNISEAIHTYLINRLLNSNAIAINIFKIGYENELFCWNFNVFTVKLFHFGQPFIRLKVCTLLS